MAEAYRRCTSCNFTGTMKTWLRNYSGPQWIAFILFFFYLIPGVIFVAWAWGKFKCPKCGKVGNNTTYIPAPVTHDDDTKQCPYCAETIKEAAIVCRYCHRDLQQSIPVPVCTAGAAIIPSLATKIYELAKTGRTLRRSEVEELLPYDFDWPEYDKYAEHIGETGHVSHTWERMDKAEMLIHAITAIAAATHNLEGYKKSGMVKYVEMLVDDDACDICLAFKGKKFPVDKAPIPCRDTHPGCRCDLLPVLD